MKMVLALGIFLAGTQAFGLILEPGESFRFGRTIVTCSEGERGGLICGLTQDGCTFSNDYRVRVGADKLACMSFDSAMNQIERLREQGICR